MATSAVPFTPEGRARRDGVPPPLGLWIRAAAIVAAICSALAAIFIFVWTPLPGDGDRKFYRAQLASLDDQFHSLSAKGEEPLSIVFVGTSRLKNVVFDAAEVAQSAKRAGITRPVASTFMAINWGGFERFGPGIDLIAQRKPDAVVIMPEFFFEDFDYGARTWLGFRYLQTGFWGQEFKVFGVREFNEPTCHGFDRTIEGRLEDHSEWIMDSRRSAGPALARATARSLADLGILVIVADVPVSQRMKALRPGFSEAMFAAESGVERHPNLRSVWMPRPFSESHYCDWAHMRPTRAGAWREAFFSQIAGDLSRRAQ